MALATIGKIFYICKLMFPNGTEIFKIHFKGVVFDENPDVIPFA
jgi:hypothetical protein